MPLVTLRRRSEREPAPEPRETRQHATRPAEPSAADVEALSRVLGSEAGAHNYTRAERYAIGRTVVNRARRYGKSVFDLLAPLGRQQNGADPPFSTARASTDDDRRLARRILRNPEAHDPTHGAGAFFEPAVQTFAVERGRLYRSDPAKYAAYYRFRNYFRTVDEIRRSWGRMLARIGRFEFYR